MKPILAILHLSFGLLSLLLCAPATAATLTIYPDQDTTIYQEDGNLGNGAGQHFYVGMDASGNVRRSLVRFDVAGMVPAGSVASRAV